jgi:hypothetical protein
MSDRAIEAMARSIYKDYEECSDEYVDRVWREGTKPKPDFDTTPEAEYEMWHAFHQTVVEFTQAAVNAWAAGVEAVIAHAPCGGTNVLTNYIFTDRTHVEADGVIECDGPHTVIDKGDGTKLYADRVQAARLVGTVVWPSDWRIE